MRKLLPALLLALAPLAGCGNDGTAEAPATEPAPTASATTETVDEGADEGVLVEVTIADGKVIPQGERVEVKVGQPITLIVSTDVADEIHVHSDPEHTLNVVAGDSGKELTFTVQTPGQVAVESHHLHATIVQLVVTP